MMGVMPSYHLRPATAEDFAFMQAAKLDGLEPYVRALWGWDRTQQENLFRDMFDPATCEVIVVNDQEVGYVNVIDEADTVFLAGLYLKASIRGRGIGSAVVRGVVAAADRRGKSVKLRVLRPNPARRLYERLGFTVVSETDTHFLLRRDMSS
jgi:ribosomal protein S18 acetylase RimI-like enzyme